jgi:hypothetical protein
MTVITPGQLLFHGSLEDFEGDLRPGGFDRAAWFADTPSVAQLYIPCAGLRVYVTPDGLRWPSLSPQIRAIQAALGIEYDEAKVERDAHGCLRSYGLPRGWREFPTVEDVAARLQGLGFPVRGAQIGFHRGRLLRPEECAPGRLFVVTPRTPLKIANLAAGGEGDLQQPQHLELSLFQRAAAAGYDGVLIHDFAQSREYGNLGHLSVGLFEHALPKTRLVEVVPATYEEFAWASATNAYPDAPPAYFRDLL